MSPDDLNREVVDSLFGRGELIVGFLSLDRRCEAAGGWRSSKGKEGSPPPRAGVSASASRTSPPLSLSLIYIYTPDHHYTVCGDEVAAAAT